MNRLPQMVPTRPSGDNSNAPASTAFVATAVAAGGSSVTTIFSSVAAGYVPASGGGTTNFLRADATFAAPPNNQVVLQVLQNNYATNAALQVAIPLDDTVPTNTEGTEVLSQAITPTDNNNRVLAQVNVWGAVGTGNSVLIVALFRGTTCINVASNTFTTANFPACVSMAYLDSPASSAAQTYTVRVGPSSTAVVVRLNGSAVGRQFGGAASSTLTLTEVSV